MCGAETYVALIELGKIFIVPFVWFKFTSKAKEQIGEMERSVSFWDDVC